MKERKQLQVLPISALTVNFLPFSSAREERKIIFLCRDASYICLTREYLKILKFILLPFSLSYFKSISYFLTFLPAGSCSFWALSGRRKTGRQAVACSTDASPVPLLETQCLISILQAASNGSHLKKHLHTWVHRLGSPVFLFNGIKSFFFFFFFFFLGIKALAEKGKQ